MHNRKNLKHSRKNSLDIKNSSSSNRLTDYFKLSHHGTTIKKELAAGITSFFAVVYIIAVNSSILSEAGIPHNGAIIATILASSIGCIIIALYSNTPLIMIPGMGINALYSYTIVGSLNMPWDSALGSVIMAGLIFTLVAFTGLGRILLESIPDSLKSSITVGIGLFLTTLGLQKSGLIVHSSTSFAALGDLSSRELQIGILILIIAIILFAKNVKGNFLLTIIIGTLLSIIAGITPLDFSSLLSFSLGSYSQLFLRFSFRDILTVPFWAASISMALVLIFSNIGVLNAYVSVMLEAPEKFERSLRANALSALSCGFLGTSPTIAAAESAAGIAVGGKTGLTSLTTGLLFLLSTPLIPFINLIPDIAVAPIFLIIGYLMVQSIASIDFKDVTEAFPAFLTIALIPFTSDIVNGMAVGFIVFPILKIFARRESEVKPAAYVIALLFCIYLVLQGKI